MPRGTTRSILITLAVIVLAGLLVPPSPEMPGGTRFSEGIFIGFLAALVSGVCASGVTVLTAPDASGETVLAASVWTARANAVLALVLISLFGTGSGELPWIGVMFAFAALAGAFVLSRVGHFLFGKLGWDWGARVGALVGAVMGTLWIIDVIRHAG
jgi:hypothetical protein